MSARSLSDSFAMAEESPSDNDEIDSLPSTSTESFVSDDDDYDAQKEWEHSLEQLQLLLTMILVPFAGKYFGRKFAYWSWTRYMEWMHDVEINWTSKKTFKAAGAAEAAATL
ncbi:Uu.00g103070.m01.CDS01 [Anthostomella pinea]|uniref:Uu.00g103070.m01.CDS01 n=1 Tax=Anthostomella pinea TaxID=933095 RepID=A0AAI8VE03_9PEZI|nr:Uu.00g103070.m01.CDS01 [Anthostomella pinea]